MHRRLLLTLLFVLSGCADRSVAPTRTSPEPTLSTVEAPALAIVDPMRAEPTWYDLESQRVFRLRNGAVEPVQDRALSEASASNVQLRVFDDDSIAVLASDTLALYPADGSSETVQISTIEVAFDGLSIDDLWYAAWFVSDEGYRLCHRTPSGTDCSVQVPNEGGYSARIAVAADGSVLVTDRDDGIYRFADGALTKIGAIEGGVTAFHRSGDSVLALASPGLYAIEGASMRQLDARYVNDVVGTANDYYVMVSDTELVKVDPDCNDSFYTSCERRPLWSQSVIEHVRAGNAVEVGHETCDEMHPEICGRSIFGLGIDSANVVLIGQPLRTLGGG